MKMFGTEARKKYNSSNDNIKGGDNNMTVTLLICLFGAGMALTQFIKYTSDAITCIRQKRQEKQEEVVEE